jgi:surfactin synthase thioesterase subunit
MNYFILPGNPPALYFYELWANEIKKSRPDASIMISQYPEIRNSDSASAMCVVHDAHQVKLKDYYNKTNRPVTLIGHSLGAYFALKLLESSLEMIERVILIHPFLRAPALQGKVILNTLKTIQHFHKPILRMRKSLECLAPNLSYVTDDEILKSFQLAHHESRTIAKDNSSVHIRPELRSKISVFYTDKDLWCSSKVIEELRKQVAVSECHEPHDFIIDSKYRQEMYQRILKSSQNIII